MEQVAGEKYSARHALIHAPILIVGVLVAVAIARSDIPSLLVGYGTAGVALASLIAGILYSSVFTVAPATVAFVELAQAGAPTLLMGLGGGIGAMIGDLSLFQIIKIGFIDRIIAVLQQRSQGRFTRLFSIPFFKMLLIGIGAVIVATPIPDEIGLALMGLGKAPWRTVALISFLCNTAGIVAISLIAG